MWHPVGAKTPRSMAFLFLVLAFLSLQANVLHGAELEEPEPEPHLYYFPMVYRDTTIAPDLVVEAITVNTDSAVVIVENQGPVEVAFENEFWVDLYVDPSLMPTGPDEVWDRVSAQGIAWGVWSKELPLAAGETDSTEPIAPVTGDGEQRFTGLKTSLGVFLILLLVGSILVNGWRRWSE